MCRAVVKKSQPLRLLVSLDSFSSESGEPPGLKSCAITGVLILAFLTAVELSLRQVLYVYRHGHPLLEDETNRQIMARHVGVDTLSCAIVAILGWFSRHINYGLWQAALGKAERWPKAAFEQRLYTYHPSGFRIALFFFLYQIKNLYDTIVWNDGPEFVFHHIFSLLTAYGAMSPGCAHYYAVFFFGLSEISTGVLCLLSNFDDDHGVPGLGASFPMVKVALGGLFVVLFLICRCVLWPIYSYYICRDLLQALKSDDARSKARRGWMRFFLVSLTGLTVLQIAWLGQIWVIAKEELIKVGLL